MLIERLPVLVLNPFGRCNCRCTMCNIWKNTEPQSLSLSEINSLLLSIEQLRVSWVVLSGGEALMHHDIWEIASALRAHGVRITLLTSGLLLSRESRQIAHHIDDVIVSLDGPPTVHDAIRGVPGAFLAIQHGIRDLRKYAPGFKIAARCTVQKLNFEHLCETVESARDIGLDSISFLAVDTTSQAFNRLDLWSPERRRSICLTQDKLSGLAEEIESLVARSRDGFVLESPRKLRKIVRHFRAEAGLEVPVSPRCNAPWNSAVIEANGDVRPCFFHRPIGTLRSRLPLHTILNSSEAIGFRSSLDIPANPTCQRCVCSLEWKTRIADEIPH